MGNTAAPIIDGAGAERVIGLRFTGRSASDGTSTAQTLVSAFRPDVLAPLWIGLRGPEQRLTVAIGPEPRRSPHYWHGPALDPDMTFDISLVVHTGMGPGGIMYRSGGDARWSSLVAASPWGAERLDWPARWNIGHAQSGRADRAFLESDLAVATTVV